MCQHNSERTATDCNNVTIQQCIQPSDILRQHSDSHTLNMSHYAIILTKMAV